MNAPDLLLRPGAASDLAEVAVLHQLARAAAVPAMPPAIHPPGEVRAWVRSWDLDTHDLVLAEAAGTLVGYARSTPTWLDDLYVHPAHQGQGIGTLLLDLVKATHPDGFGLWVFVSNTPARAFYARQGLVEVRVTDGSENEEQAPDVELRWDG